MRPLLALLVVLTGAARASHPLITEDTGVLGEARWQIELHGERVRDSGAYATAMAAALSYGFARTADLQLEQPYTHSGETRRADAVLSLKWRFYERDGLSMVLKPDLEEGRRWGLNLVAGYARGRVELLAHAGYLRNRNAPGERESLRHASIAAVVAATGKLKLALDLGRDTSPDRASGAALREAVFGLMYAPSEDVDLGLGLKKGLSDPADDRALLAGVKLRF